ncbi:hypothetical protein HMPREF9946_01265 [Acetobacteraceae bacterium AT-5844]|nr:hypothetical protein HMPREF9946_01265 [Acetobacteraceae bacterium AT-5844]
MNLSYSLVGALGGDPSLRVLGPDNRGRVTVSRSGTAMAFTAADRPEPAPPDTPRFSGTARRLLVEGRRVNLLRNPRGENSLQYWILPAMISGAGTGTEDDLPYVDLACAFTGGSTAQNVTFEPNAFIPATQGQAFTLSFYVRRMSGSAAGFTNLRMRFREANTGGGFLGDHWKDVAVASLPDMSQPPLRLSFTTTVLNASTMFLTAGFRMDASAAGNMVLRISALQVEQAAFASSPVMPPAGAPASASREADMPLWSPPGGFGSQGTVVVKAMLPQLAPFGASQGLWQIDDGTDQNRLQLRNTSAGAAITGVVEAGGTTLATLSAGNMTPGVPFRAAFTWAEGSQALCLGGGAVQVASAALPPGLIRMLVGHASTQLNRAAFGEIELVDYRPTRVSDGMLQALANAL